MYIATSLLCVFVRECARVLYESIMMIVVVGYINPIMHHINNIISHLIPSSYLNHYVIQEKIAKRPKKNTTEVSYLYWIADVLIGYSFVVYQYICMGMN